MSDGKYYDVLSGSLELFREFGIRSLSMDDLARNMKISKKTLYQFFDNKEDLVRKVLIFQAKENDDAFRTLMNKQLNAVDALISASRMVNTQIANLNPAMIFDLRKYYPEILEQLIHEKKSVVYDYITFSLQLGISQQLYRKDINIDVTAAIYLEQLELMHRSEFMHSKDFSFSYIFDTMFDNHIRGIVNENGLNYYEEKIKNFKTNE